MHFLQTAAQYRVAAYHWHVLHCSGSSHPHLTSDAIFCPAISVDIPMPRDKHLYLFIADADKSIRNHKVFYIISN